MRRAGDVCFSQVFRDRDGKLNYPLTCCILFDGFDLLNLKVFLLDFWQVELSFNFAMVVYYLNFAIRL